MRLSSAAVWATNEWESDIADTVSLTLSVSYSASLICVSFGCDKCPGRR